MLECATHGDRERIDLHRLGDEVICTRTNRGDRGLEATLTGQYDRE